MLNITLHPPGLDRCHCLNGTLRAYTHFSIPVNPCKRCPVIRLSRTPALPAFYACGAVVEDDTLKYWEDRSVIGIKCPATTEKPAETARRSAEFGLTPLFTSLSEIMAMVKLGAASHCLPVSEKLISKCLLEISVATSAVMARRFVHEFRQQAANGSNHVQGSFHLVTTPENRPLMHMED